MTGDVRAQPLLKEDLPDKRQIIPQNTKGQKVPRVERSQLAIVSRERCEALEDSWGVRMLSLIIKMHGAVRAAAYWLVVSHQLTFVEGALLVAQWPEAISTSFVLFLPSDVTSYTVAWSNPFDTFHAIPSTGDITVSSYRRA